MAPLPYLPGTIVTVGSIVTSDHRDPWIVTTYNAKASMQSAGTFDWFEDFHVIPRSFDFGNLLSAQSLPIEVFSAFRRDPHEWTGFTNGAGAGVELTGMPTLPTEMQPLTGFAMTLDISATGDPFVDDVLSFLFDIGTIDVPIAIKRIVLWGIEPELPYKEILSFLTDILRKRSGSEQRIALRKNPRQRFLYPYKIDEGPTMRTLENLLFDWQSRVFGVPVWREETELTVAAIAGDTTINVTQTAYRDFRVGGLVVVFVSQSTFDVILITSIGATTIGLDSPLLNAYAVGVRVFPLSTCTVKATISGGRHASGMTEMQIEFTNTDNDSNLASTAAFTAYNGKVLLDGGNSVIGELVSESFNQELVELDGQTGLFEIESPWDRHKREHAFVLRASGMQAIWEMRQLLHALRGKQVSLYVPRGSDDFVVVANLLNASNTMDIQLVGYAQFVRNRQAKNVIMVTKTDGTTLLRAITASAVSSPTVETLTVDVNWPSTITVAQVARVEIVEKVRLDDDDVEIEYAIGGRVARMTSPIVDVFE